MRYSFYPDDLKPPLFLVDGDSASDIPIVVGEVTDEGIEIGRYYWDDGQWLREAGSDRDGRDVLLTRDGLARLVTGALGGFIARVHGKAVVEQPAQAPPAWRLDRPAASGSYLVTVEGETVLMAYFNADENVWTEWVQEDRVVVTAWIPIPAAPVLPSSVEVSDEQKQANAAALVPPPMASLSRW